MKTTTTLTRTSLLTVLMLAAGLSQADHIYTLGVETAKPEDGLYYGFSATQGNTGAEYTWQANSYTAIAGANVITSVQLVMNWWGQGLTLTPLLYTGIDVHNPQAGLTLVAQGPSVISALPSGYIQNLPLSAPVTLSVGQVFYAGIYIPITDAATQFPLWAGAGSWVDQGQSWIAAGGPNNGDPLDYVNILTNGTAGYGTGGNPGVFNPVSWGDPNLTINAVGVPEPSTLVLLGISAISLLAYAWRRQRQAA